MTLEELEEKVRIAERKADELIMAWDLVRREAARVGEIMNSGGIA